MVAQVDENRTQHVVHGIQQVHHACKQYQQCDEIMANYLHVTAYTQSSLFGSIRPLLNTDQTIRQRL